MYGAPFSSSSMGAQRINEKHPCWVHPLGDYLKYIARVCKVDIMFCISKTLHALDSARFMLWIYTVVRMCSKLLD